MRFESSSDILIHLRRRIDFGRFQATEKQRSRLNMKIERMNEEHVSKRYIKIQSKHLILQPSPLK
jgi:hypothetical protein